MNLEGIHKVHSGRRLKQERTRNIELFFAELSDPGLSDSERSEAPERGAVGRQILPKTKDVKPAMEYQ